MVLSAPRHPAKLCSASVAKRWMVTFSIVKCLDMVSMVEEVVLGLYPLGVVFIENAYVLPAVAFVAHGGLYALSAQ